MYKNHNQPKQLEVINAATGKRELMEIHPGARPGEVLNQLQLSENWEVVSPDGHSKFDKKQDLYPQLPDNGAQAYVATPTRVGEMS